MMEAANCLVQAIREYRARYMVSSEFSACLDRLESQGFSLRQDPTASTHPIRWSAASFIVHYIEFVLDDHRLSEKAKWEIFSR